MTPAAWPRAALAALVLCSCVAPTALASASRIPPDVCSVHIQSQGKTLFGRLFSPALDSAASKAPSVLMLHGIPGTEQNFDVAYALRDVGFNCLLWHYRGCWGSEGAYSIEGLPDDIDAALRLVSPLVSFVLRAARAVRGPVSHTALQRASCTVAAATCGGVCVESVCVRVRSCAQLCCLCFAAALFMRDSPERAPAYRQTQRCCNEPRHLS